MTTSCLLLCWSDASGVGESRPGGGEAGPPSPSRLFRGDEGLYPGEPERVSLHDSEGTSVILILLIIRCSSSRQGGGRRESQ